MRKEKSPRPNPILMAFGFAAQKRRRDLGISQEEAAARIGLHRTYYADIERGSRNLGLKNVVAVARGLGVTPSHLLRDLK